MCPYSRCSTLALSFLLLCSSAATAQNKTTDRYAAESFVIEHRDWVYSNNADGTGWREHTVAVAIKSEAALRAFGVIGVQFASASEHVEFRYARVRHKDGSVTETPAKDAMEQPEEVTREAPFYSDLKQEQLPVKNLQVGDTLEWQARIVRTRAETTNEFYGQEAFLGVEDGVALKETIELRVPAASAATVWTNPRLGVKPVETMDGATKVYRWETAQLQPTAGPEADASKKAREGRALTADEALDESEGKLPSVVWTTFKNWEAVGAWYRGLEGSRAVPDDEIKAKVVELTEGKTTDEDKARAVYAYVSAQIRYIGVAFGIGRFQPHEADDVLHNQYGDCKDKATLLAAMLAAAGLHADSVLIGAEVRLNEAVPSPAAFNHLITHLMIDGKDVWLDSTAEVAPYKVLLYPLRDKLALVVPEQGPAKLQRTPKELPFPSADVWTASGTLDSEGTSESHITMSVRGDDEVAFREAVHQVLPARYDELVQKIVKSIGYQGTSSHAEVSRPDDTADPFHFSFDYHREKSGDWGTLRIVPQLAPVSMPTVDEKNPPTQSILLGSPHTETSSAAMKLPAGWSVELPEAVHETSAYVTYDLTYRFEKGTIYADRKVVVLKSRVPPDDWKTYKKFTDGINLGYEAFIQLRRGDGNKAGVAIMPRSNDAETKLHDLFEQMSAAYNAKDEKAMEDALKKMKSIDPKARRYWAGKASLANLRSKWDEALEDDRKELQLYPDELDRYAAMLWIEERKKDKEGAISVLREWAVAAPQDPKPPTSLSIALLNEKKYDESMDAARQAIKRATEGSPEGNRARMLLGKAQLKAGKTEEGHATLMSLLKSTEDPAILNDASYELADAKLELPLAEEDSRKAIDALTAETQSWTMDESASILLQKTSLLEASWDTMGWILFREGKFAEAKTWLLAANHARKSDEVKDHMKQEWEALNGAPGVDPNQADPAEGRSDVELRTVDLGNRQGNLETASYKVLLTAGHVERAEPTGSDQVTGADELLKAGNFSAFFPKDSKAKLYRTGTLRCEAGRCFMILNP